MSREMLRKKGEWRRCGAGSAVVVTNLLAAISLLCLQLAVPPRLRPVSTTSPDPLWLPSSEALTRASCRRAALAVQCSSEDSWKSTKETVENGS
jgi:hypothetical protein